MKILFLGLGSIGKRHLRILKGLTDAEIISLESGRRQLSPAFIKEYGIIRLSDFHQAIKTHPDFAIIANPTYLHLNTALKLANAGIPFLIEKPVSDSLEGLDKLKKIVTQKKLPVMVGFQLRHHPGYKKMVEIINSGKVGQPLNLQGHVGQFLPTWRPEVDYRKSYSAKKDAGGGVILDLCHELDIAVSIMDQVESINCYCDHYSDLEIDTEDIADITMKHKYNRVSHIHLNYLEPKYKWVTRVMGTSGSIVWDYGRGFVEITNTDGSAERWEDPSGFDRDELFRAQMIQWLSVLAGEAEPEVDLENGINITHLCIEAKRSTIERRQIKI